MFSQVVSSSLDPELAKYNGMEVMSDYGSCVQFRHFVSTMLRDNVCDGDQEAANIKIFYLDFYFWVY